MNGGKAGRAAALVAMAVLWAPGASAQVSGMQCPNAQLWGSALFTDICWSCLFPIRVMGRDFINRPGTVPPDASTSTVCFCDGPLGLSEVGFTTGFWMPARLIEIVRKPYCSPALGGTTLHSGSRLWGMHDGPDRGSKSNQFYNYHYFSFPLYEILELFVAPECNPGSYSEFDLLYLSEIDPTWSEDELAMFVNPEGVVMANPALQASCMADCAASTNNAPTNNRWWCAGCWGNLYPFTGNVPSGGDAVRVSSLLSTRALAAIHRRGLAWRTVGDDVLCEGGEIHHMLPKQQYKMSLLFPVSEADNQRVPTGLPLTELTGVAELDSYNWEQGCCHNIGVPAPLWGAGRTRPGTGEDFVYILWRWSDCCIRPGSGT